MLAHRKLAGVNMGRQPPAGQAKIPGIGYHHAYAVFGFDPKTDLVTLWNPWGQNFQPKGQEGVAHGFATKHGIFRIPLKTLYAQFSNMVWETNEPAVAKPSKAPRSSHGR